MFMYTEYVNLLTPLYDFFNTPTGIKFYDTISNSLTFNNMFSPAYWLDCYQIVNPTTHSIPFVSKLVFCLAVLIVIRGGVPRYRYDLLTKMG